MVWMGMIAAALPAYGACERELQGLEAASGEAVAAAFGAFAGCDAGKAREAFPAAVKRSGDVQSLAALSVVAIDAGLQDAVHGLLELIPDYAAREETARAIGAGCGESGAVEGFIADLHGALGDRAFVGWAGALRSCGAEGLTGRLQTLAAAPPDRDFDDKYATVVDLYATKRRTEALPVLKQAAASAAASGPFAAVVDAMVKAVTPEGLGAKPAPADRDALVAALSELSAEISAPDALRRVANALVAADAPDAAGALLPKLYADRVQSDGSFLYGVAAIERCGDVAVVHWAVVTDPTKRWSIDDAVEGPARAFKPRLKKCDGEIAWTITPTLEPVKEANDVQAWAEGLASEIGESAKLKSEKKILISG